MGHRWKFVRAGGFDQVEITTGADLAALATLDQKLWVALSCPTRGVELDARTLELVDLDHDGRIRAPELLAAVKWALEVLDDPDDLVPGTDGLALSSLDASTAEGKLLAETGRAILDTLGKRDAKVLTVEDTTKAGAAFAQEPFNGDGVVPEGAATEPELAAAIRDALSCTAAPELDRCGKSGVSAASLAAFFGEITAHAEWLAQGAAHQPLGAETTGAVAAYAAVAAKIDDYFARTKIAAYDPRAVVAMNGEEKQYATAAAKELDRAGRELEALPLALVAPDRPLPLAAGVSPAWADRLAAFRARVVVPILGEKDHLTEADWMAIGTRLAGHLGWAKAKQGASVEKLGPARVRELAGGDLRARLEALVRRDTERTPQAKALEAVEKIVRLHRDLMTLVNNFVSFRDFYSRKGPAMFQAGTLYLDTRACELTVPVTDAARHAAMAPLSNLCLVYADLKNAKAETMQIAAAMTAGDTDNLMVGRNGIFYDRKGRDWDATVTKIVMQPIGIRQAFWSPYKKVLRMIEERIAARAAEEAAANDAQLGAAVAGAAPAGTAPPLRRIDVGTVAALGVAVGGITAALGALFGAILGLGIWMPLGILGIVLCISGPSMAVAWLKLRKRNLGPLLDANGWAVNAQAIVNVPLGASLTQEARLPPGSRRDLSDPFVEKPRPWGLYAALLVLLLGAGGWYLGHVDAFLPAAARSTTILGPYAPASVPADPPDSTMELEEPVR